MSATTSKPAYYESYWVKNDDWTPDKGVNNPQEKELFDRLLKPGMTLIDYGCGNGERYGRDMLARQIDYRGFDISEVALENAARLGLKVGRIGQDSSIPVSNDSADAAICFEVLEHLMEPDRALAEILRTLKPGGFAIVSVPNAAFITQRIEFLLTGFWNPGGSPLTARRTPWRDAHIRFYNPALLRRMLEAGGFEFSFLLTQPFSLSVLPWCYKQTRLHPLLDALSLPFAWLGRALPGLFAPRLFAVVKKPV
jgi:SAM-dependent methyltransferase